MNFKYINIGYFIYFFDNFSNNFSYSIIIGLYVTSTGKKISEFDYAKENPNGKFICQLYNKMYNILYLRFEMDVKLYMFVYDGIYCARMHTGYIYYVFFIS